MRSSLRVALFTDSFNEANGVATLTQQFANFARHRDLPFFCVHNGPATRLTRNEQFTTVELKRSLASFPLDLDLYCDPLLNRYKPRVTRQLQEFQPDLVHITGPGDMGVLGFWVAHTLGVPLVASWHTNLHEYAACRLEKFLASAPSAWRARVASQAKHQSLRACIRFYRMARFLLAPNEAMVDLLHERTHKPAYLMRHGVDLDRYSPARRTGSGKFRIGYVGRLTPEKNVRLFVELERRLLAAGKRDFELVLVGEGSEREWLRRNLQCGVLPGILRGPELAAAFADMDVFVFPSRTDTFGLVLLEAMASGTPVVLSPETGMRVGVQNGVTGLFATGIDAFARSVLDLMECETSRHQMRCAARQSATSRSWNSVFEHLYETYELGLEENGLRKRELMPVRAE